ncbi:hypothetical protein [Actinoplanes derwentensis]|uniref:Lipoprotein n=1 Tax=Actinoplanes derwentensis TaxID=113562 RepID=A0A1H2CEX8_9ACTN|nr:hypothetical protein [Actinoplanes derwentensis]GID86033.1 hypothetical protein Ade03nite_49570 [Actinoplanes derwentensis]SDT68787.1 hypothetical protein SAMN04489716_5675 [Actinoplanes derwentensis]
MNVFTKRLASTGALLIAGSVLTACGVGEAVQGVAEEVSAVSRLTDAVPTTETPAFRYRIKGGVQPIAGVLDAPHQAMVSEIDEQIPDADFTFSMKLLVVGDQSWTKISFDGAPEGIGLPKVSKKWMKLDLSRFSAADAEGLTYNGETDPGYVGALLLAAADLTETGTGTFTGTTDLTRTTAAEIVEPEVLTALGEKAKTVPLKVTLDAEGRIATAVVEIPAAGKAKAGTYEVTYDQYGSAAAVRAPADGVKAPADVYEFLKS